LKELALEDIKRILRSCAGEVESLDHNGDVLDVSFTDLGYDSLALLEAAALIWREYGVALVDEDIDVHETLRAFLDKVNGMLVRRQSAS
jgi:acyl carrier protein